MKTFILNSEDISEALIQMNELQLYIPTKEGIIEEIEKYFAAKQLPNNTYTIIPWPESQEYMNKSWFDDEAILDIEMKHGSSAYFIPTKYIKT